MSPNFGPQESPADTLPACEVVPSTAPLSQVQPIVDALTQNVQQTTAPLLTAIEALVGAVYAELQQGVTPTLQRVDALVNEFNGLAYNFWVRLGIPPGVAQTMLPTSPPVSPPPVPLSTSVGFPGTTVPGPAPIAGSSTPPSPAPLSTSVGFPSPVTNVVDLVRLYLTQTQQTTAPPAAPTAPPPLTPDVPTVSVPGYPPPVSPPPPPPPVPPTPPLTDAELVRLVLELTQSAAVSAAAAAESAQAAASVATHDTSLTITGPTVNVAASATASAAGSATATAAGGSATATVTVPPPAPPLPPPGPGGGYVPAVTSIKPTPTPEGPSLGGLLDAGAEEAKPFVRFWIEDEFGDLVHEDRPDIDPPYDFAAAGLTPIPRLDAVEKGDWLKRMHTLRGYLEQLGKAIVAGDGTGLLWPRVHPFWSYALAYGLASTTAKSGDLAQQLERLENIPSVKLLLAEWWRACQAGWLKDDPTLLYVQAAASVLHNLAKAACTAHTDNETAGKFGTNLHPQVVGLGMGGDVVVTTTHATGIQVEAWVWLVPLLTQVDQCVAYYVAGTATGIDGTLECWVRGLISEAAAEDYVRFAGGDWLSLRRLAMARSLQLSAEESIEYARRTGQDADWLDNRLRRAGIVDEQVLEVVKTLFDEIPPITDLLRFAQRNVTVDDVVKRFGLSDEFERFWQGALRDGLTAQGVSKDWAELYWRAHWVTASVATGQDALRRLRPGRVDPALEFTKADLENLFRENDVLPFWRQRLIALAYTPPGLRQIQLLVTGGQYNVPQTSDALQDIGYAPADADRIALSMQKVGARQRATQLGGLTPAKLQRYWIDGALTDQQVIDELNRQFYTAAEQREWFDAATATMKAEAQKERIAGLKSAYLHGNISIYQARDNLTQIGVPAQRVNELFASWQLLARGEHGHATVSQLVNWFKEGLISAPSLQQRVAGLGWPPEDVQHLVQEAIAKLTADRQKAAQAALKAAQAAAAKAQAAAAKQAKQAAARKKAADRTRLEQILALSKEEQIRELAKIKADKETELGADTTTTGKARTKAQFEIEKGQIDVAAVQFQTAAKVAEEQANPPQ